MTAPRITRAVCVQPRKARAAMTTGMERSVKEFSITIAPSRNGMPMNMSVTRESTASTQPPK